MAGIPDDKLQELRDRIDIVDLINQYVGLQRAGKNYKACCPFHQEKTPSFYVNPERRSYKCFGCGVYGDGLQFVMELEGVGFLEAARKLAERYGVQLPNTGRPDKIAARHAERERAYAIMRCALDTYREILLHAPEGALARAYQQTRGITDEASETFLLGYAPAPTEAGWDRLARALASNQLSLELAEKLGLIGRSERTGAHFDKFRGRLMFPIIQAGGSIVGFSGRVLPEHATETDGRTIPKYVNSPESLLYKKSKTLFGLHAAGQNMRRRGRAILVEGNVDVVSMHQRGFHETVAPLGTSLTSMQVEVIARFTSTVVLCFDGDAAGLKAARAAIPLLLEAGLDARIVVLDAGEDPDSVDPERLTYLFERPSSALLWMIERMVADGATESFDAQARALDAIAPLLAKVKSDAARDLYVDRAAKLLNLSPQRISALLRGNGRSRGGGRPANGRFANDRFAGEGNRRGFTQSSGPMRNYQDPPYRSQRQKQYPDRGRFSGGGRSQGGGFRGGGGGFKKDAFRKGSFNPRGPSPHSPQSPAPYEGLPPGFFDGPPPEPLERLDHLDRPGGDPPGGPPPDFGPPDFGPPPGPEDFGPPAGFGPPASFGPPPEQGPPRPDAGRPPARLPALPREQASIVALLVDNPHLAGVAERSEVLEHITDARLEPIARAVIEAAKHGANPSEGELLELIDTRAHRQVHDAVFSGAYRETELDPQEVLGSCLRGCKRHVLKRKRDEAALAMRRAHERGDLELVRTLSKQRVELARQLIELDREPTPPRGQA